ncbi:MAG: alpha/beta fold hydrolase [Deltaproteobacteria bacterium]|nr:alpha/beta fold hydrolase [Deltaproteobacteria bacterium]
MRALCLIACAAILAGCPPPPQPDDDDEVPTPPRVFEDIDSAFELPGDRPVAVFVPTVYDGKTPLPLLLFLHGYGATGEQMDRFVGMAAFAERNNFIYATPDGTLDGSGKTFWNATGACCDFGGTDVDDAAFLRGVIEGAQEQANIDPKQVFVIGHSNGGFMAQRLACDASDVVAGVVSLAGAADGSGGCLPDNGVAVLQVHGTADETVAYGGGSLGAANYPGAIETVELWASLNGCDLLGIDDVTPIDIEANLAGAETTVTRYDSNCVDGSTAELWTTTGGTHVPAPNATYLQSLWDFLAAHPKP